MLDCSYLLSPVRFSSILNLKNKVVLAPMIQRTASSTGVPDANMLDFYSSRSNAGLLVAEATMIAQSACAYPNMPGIFNAQQIGAWSNITDAVHKKNSKIFVQLWHPGRLSHRDLRAGEKPIAPSSIKAAGKLPWSQLYYDNPREMTTQDIECIVTQYRNAAANAMSAGFDGVEIHAANGYLIEQFLRFTANQRHDQYGGNPINNCRFPLKIIDEIIDTIGKGKLGIRVSLENSETLPFTDDDSSVYKYFLENLNLRSIAYVHLSSQNGSKVLPLLNMNPVQFVRGIINHPVIGSGSYTPQSANQALRGGECSLVSFGRIFLFCKDLVKAIGDEISFKNIYSTMENTNEK